MPEEENKTNALNDLQKAQVQFILEEFRAANANIAQQLTLQGNTASISSSVLAGFVGASVILLKEAGKWEKNYGWLLISFSMICAMLGLWCIDKDQVVLSNAFFIRDHLKNEAAHVLGEEAAQGIFVAFKYQGYNWSEYGYMEWGKRMASLFPHFLFMTFSLVPLLAVVRFSLLPGFRLTDSQKVMMGLADAMQYWLWRCEWLTVMKYTYLWKGDRPLHYEQGGWIRGFFGRGVEKQLTGLQDIWCSVNTKNKPTDPQE